MQSAVVSIAKIASRRNGGSGENKIRFVYAMHAISREFPTILTNVLLNLEFESGERGLTCRTLGLGWQVGFPV